ncbi:uncharacterized protein CC84DRAFT_897815 [Paraphaeosphaeria sporulosa]|uniref:Uncharacterized protein n=1 Tax=Paraphaeosphaeria sporulosa TaxID=1460663 RepID=A0A177C6R8_9PLEO|nr:uncharacterized protein CC84DRAFT_897815 [Paraphaeosphaeria sporulosa]OAG02562.1 hypothetical protein CC84DRAFT_897815 [Paraphaeosphaeria sporulosa]
MGGRYLRAGVPWWICSSPFFDSLVRTYTFWKDIFALHDFEIVKGSCYVTHTTPHHTQPYTTIHTTTICSLGNNLKKHTATSVKHNGNYSKCHSSAASPQNSRPNSQSHLPHRPQHRPRAQQAASRTSAASARRGARRATSRVPPTLTARTGTRTRAAV